MCGSAPALGAVVVPGLLLGVLLGAVVVALVADLGAVLLQRREGGGVDGVLDAGLGDRVVDGGLDALEVEDDVGLAELADLLRLELQVVGFDAGLGERVDGDVVAAYLLGQVLHGVERRDHVQLAAASLVGGVGGSGAGGEGDDAERDGSGDGGGGYEATYVHDTHFQQNWKRLSIVVRVAPPTRPLGRSVYRTDLIRGVRAPVT